MPPKRHRPRSRHARFAPLMFRLAGNDWVIAVFCPANRQAGYFLAEPAVGEHVYVTALERVGESACALAGLPRHFKCVEDAAEWLEDHLEHYEGDTFVEPRTHGEALLQTVPEAAAEPCDLPPPGWRCSRTKGHEGPCAARAVDVDDGPAAPPTKPPPAARGRA